MPMSERLTQDMAQAIPDESERVVAQALLSAFPAWQVFYQVGLHGMSGKMPRVTNVDFQVVNEHGEDLFIEVTRGTHKTKRKRRQRKTAGLAGLGQRYAILYGPDIEYLQQAPKGIREAVTRVLLGKFDASQFTLQ